MTPPPCKCCGSGTRQFGAVDASRTCNDRHGAPTFPPSGRMIPYWRCGACGFVFTDAFDGLSDAGMQEAIYNDAYVKADPDFLGARPKYLANEMVSYLGHRRHALRCLDYGGGAGAFAGLMREARFDYANHDPYFADGKAATGPFDLVTAFEVVEHSRDPVATFADAWGRVAREGVLVFSTQLLPPRAGIDWWYVAPRNGHVSIHTDMSLMACARRLGVTVVSLDSAIHAMFIGLPPLATDLVRRFAWTVMDRAAQLGLAQALSRARLVAQCGGGIRAAMNPRHLGHAMLTSLRRRDHRAP